MAASVWVSEPYRPRKPSARSRRVPHKRTRPRRRYPPEHTRIPSHACATASGSAGISSSSGQRARASPRGIPSLTPKASAAPDTSPTRQLCSEPSARARAPYPRAPRLPPAATVSAKRGMWTHTTIYEHMFPVDSDGYVRWAGYGRWCGDSSVSCCRACWFEGGAGWLVWQAAASASAVGLSAG